MLRLTRLASRPRLVVAAIAVLAALAGFYGAGLEDKLDPFRFDDPQEERVRAARLLEQASGVDPQAGIVVLVRGRYDSRSAQRRLARARSILRGHPAVGAVVGPEELPGAVSRERDAAYLVGYFRAARDSKRQDDAVEPRSHDPTSKRSIRLLFEKIDKHLAASRPPERWTSWSRRRSG